MRAIQTSARCGASWISLFIVTGLALVEEVVRVEADVRVVAVVVVKPDNMVNYPTRLIPAHLAQPAIHGQPAVYVCLPGTSPGWCLIEFLLVYICPPAHLASVSYAGVKMFN